jgi:hypothetical protein
MLLCRDWSAILNMDAPLAAALVRNPKAAGSSPNAGGMSLHDLSNAAIGEPPIPLSLAVGD